MKDNFQQIIDEALRGANLRNAHQMIKKTFPTANADQVKAIIAEMEAIIQRVNNRRDNQKNAILNKSINMIKHPYKTWTQDVGGFLDKLHKG
jgi:hypothetical protein